MNINPTQQIIAARVVAHAQAKDRNFSVDPSTIVAIINCIIAVMKLLYYCYTTRDGVISNIKKSGLIHNLLLKREIRRNFKDKGERKAVFIGMRDVAKNLSQDEIDCLLDSVIGDN